VPLIIEQITVFGSIIGPLSPTLKHDRPSISRLRHRAGYRKRFFLWNAPRKPSGAMWEWHDPRQNVFTRLTIGLDQALGGVSHCANRIFGERTRVGRSRISLSAQAMFGQTWSTFAPLKTERNIAAYADAARNFIDNSRQLQLPSRRLETLVRRRCAPNRDDFVIAFEIHPRQTPPPPPPPIRRSLTLLWAK